MNQRVVYRRTYVKLGCWLAIVVALLLLAVGPANAQSNLEDFLQPQTLPEVFPGADRVGPKQGEPPAAPAYKGDQLLGYIYLNSDIVSSTGYSGKPIRILVAIDLGGRIVGAKLVEHHEPIVLIGIPAAKLTAFIRSYVGQNIGESPKITTEGAPVDIISGATVTTMVIGDSITRSAIRVAESRRLGTAGAALAPAAATAVKRIAPDRLSVESWQTLLGDGSVRHLALSVGEVNAAFAKSDNKLAADHPEAGPDSDSFIDLYIAEASVPSIGRSLLGDVGYQALKERLQPGQQAIMIAGSGRYSFKGSGYVRGGIFDRIQLVQGDTIIRFHDRDQERIGDLHADGAPRLSEIDLFTIPPGEHFDPTAPWRLVLLVQRAIGARDKAFLTFDLSYEVPAQYVIEQRPAVTVATPPPTPAGAAAAPTAAPPAASHGPAAVEQPLWQRAWRAKAGKIVVLLAALTALTVIFFFQDALVRRPVLYRRLRLAFLVFTLFWLGWYADAQLSVVNILAFISALRTDFRWDNFLMDPLIFILWAAVAAGMLFWGRGAFCGWLCPFGALQELLNAAAKRLRVPQLSVPSATLAHQVYRIPKSFRAFSLLPVVERGSRRGRAVQDRDRAPVHARVAICVVCRRAAVGWPVRRAVFLPLSLSAWRRSGDPGPDAHVRLAAALSRMRQSLPTLRPGVPGPGDPSGRSHQSQRVHPVPALPGTLP